MTLDLLPGLQSATVATARVETCVITAGPDDGEPVIFVHGNVSASRFWEETLTALPDDYRGIAVDLRGYGRTEAAPVDATRGLRDWSDDVVALMDALGIDGAHLVGWSMGGGVAMQLAIDHPDRVRSVTLVAAMSPYGFGGTGGAEGMANSGDYAGSGAGTASPVFVQRIAARDTSGDDANSPRNVMNNYYFKPPFTSLREDVFVEEMLSTRLGDDHYPGDMATSESWPGVGPGTRGINNALSPKYVNLRPFAAIHPQPPVLWIHGADDQIVSDTSLFDLGFLGQLGAVPGWPGAEAAPAQPMVSQLRAVLDEYAAQGGSYTEIVLPETGHSPHVERPDEFGAALAEFLASA